MLTADQIKFFDDNGFLLVKGLLSRKEAAKYRKSLRSLFDRIDSKQVDATWGSAGEKGVTKLQHCHDVQFYDASFGKLIADDRLIDATADLIKSPNVQLHHTKAFIKPPENGSPFPLHQDAPFFPHQRESMIAAIIHFDDVYEKKGCVRVMPGTHKNGILPHISQGSFHLDKEKYPMNKAIPAPAEAGDVLFISYLVIHGSGINESDEERVTLLVQMRDPEDLPTVETHVSKGQGMMLRGINPIAGQSKLPSETMAKSISDSMNGFKNGGMNGSM
ncbi:phytanoyl-CoA dioxygenase [Xylogone sp. PMI_703]|nr:phytanoyl-CoA dioxygenase [Xylogone sp. PMI_703]